ncbi:hypothetical protein K8I85_04235, partial [bacterium]|nr:hypothetical protein [bacterium]
VGTVAVLLDEADKLTFTGNTVLMAENTEPLKLGSRALEIYFGKTNCTAQGGNQRTLSIDGNVLEGPGFWAEERSASGIYANWVCGGSYRDVEITDNWIHEFDRHGMEFYQSSDVDVTCNAITRNFRAVEHRRDSEPTGAGIRFRTNLFTTPLGPLGLVRTDYALKTKMGPATDKGDNEFWTVGSDTTFPRFILEDEPGNSHTGMNATNNFWFRNGTQLDDADSVNTRILIWTTLPDTTSSDPPYVPQVSVLNLRMLHPTEYVGLRCWADTSGGGASRIGGGRTLAARPARDPEDDRSAALNQAAPRVTRLGLPTPNPFRGNVAIQLDVSAEHEGWYRVEVFDVSGRRVAVLLEGPLSADRYPMVWNGRSMNGRVAGPGVYFLRVEGRGIRHNAKLVVIR